MKGRQRKIGSREGREEGRDERKGYLGSRDRNLWLIKGRAPPPCLLA